MKYVLIIFWLIVLFLAMTPPGEVDWNFPWWLWVLVFFGVLFSGLIAYVNINEEKIIEQAHKERRKRRQMLKSKKRKNK